MRASIVLVIAGIATTLLLASVPASTLAAPIERCFVATATSTGVVDARGHRWVCARIPGLAPYDPHTLIVSPGTIVNWTNTDPGLPHTVSALGSTSGESFNNFTNPGQKASIKFGGEGITHYACRVNALHTAVMHGAVIVRA